MLTEAKMGMLKDGVTAPERTFVTWPNKHSAGRAFNRSSSNRTEYIRADLAVPAQVRVKPLVWTPIGNDPCAYEWKAAKPFGSAYYLLRNASGLYGWIAGEDRFGPLEAAKAAAQADYEARILSALEPQPDPRDEVIARLVEAIESVIGQCSIDREIIANALATAKAVMK